MNRPAGQQRGILDFVLGFGAGALIVGLPVGLIFGLSWPALTIVVVAGILGGLFGDRFLLAVGDSYFWAVIKGLWRWR